MNGKALEFGIVITADGKIAVTEAGRVERQFKQLGTEGRAAGEQMAAGSRAAEKAAAGLSAQLGQAAQKQEQYAVSTRQMQAALRGVPAQFTDIATSLAAGQNPMQVFLQQGGQLKDMFGGAGPAARALGGYIAGLVNPVTVAGAAIVGLAVAAEMGRRESEGMARAIIMSGNAAGTTVGQMQAYSRTVSDATGATRGAAADALTQLTATGKVSTEMLGRAAETAVRLQRVGGPAIDDTVARFAELGKSPVEASLKLNEQTNYLTGAVYLQIKALQEQNDIVGAAALAQKTYADVMAERTPEMEKNIGDLERAWRGVRDMVLHVGSAMMDINRVPSTADQIAALEQKAAPGRGFFAGRSNEEDAELARLRVQLAAEEKTAVADKQRRKDVEDLARAKAEADKSATHQIATLKNSLADLKNAPDGEDKTRRELELTRQIRDLRHNMGAEERALVNARIDGALKQSEAAQKAASAHLQARNQLGQVTDSQVLNAQALAAEQHFDEEIAALQRKRRDATVAEQAKMTAEIKVLETQRQAQRQETLDKFDLMEDKAGRESIARDAAIAKERGQVERAYTLDYIAKNQLAMREAYAAGDAALIAQIQTQFDVGLGNARFTAVKQEYDLLFEQLKAELEAVRQEAERDGGWLAGINAAGKAEEIKSRLMPQLDELGKKLDDLADKSPLNKKTAETAKRELQKTANEIAPIWKNAVQGIDRTFHDGFSHMLEGGKNSWQAFSESLKNTFKTTVADAAYQMFARPFVFRAVASVGTAMGASGAANAFGSVGGGGGIGDLFSMGSAANSLFGGASAAYSTGAYMTLGSMGAEQAAMLAAQDAVFGAAGTAATLEAAGASAFMSTVGAALPYVGAALAVASALGVFDGGGEDPHNNTQLTGFELGLNRSGAFGVQNSDATGAPSSMTAGPTSGEGWWADSANLSAEQLAAINAQVTASFAQGHKLAQLFGVDPSVIDAASVDSRYNGTAGNGHIQGYFSTMDQAFAALSDQIVEAVWPDVTKYQQAGKSVTQTLTDNIAALDAFNAGLGNLHKQFSDFNNQLDLGAGSTLDPLSKYRTARGLYDTAISGTDSAAAITAAKDFLQISRDVFSSTASYATDYGMVKTALAALESTLTTQASASLPESLKALQAAMPSHAAGLSVVPYDGYMATLHRDEAVIDAGAMGVLRRYGIPTGADSSKLEAHMAASVRVSAAGLQLLVEEVRSLKDSVASIERTSRLAALAA